MSHVDGSRRVPVVVLALALIIGGCGEGEVQPGVGTVTPAREPPTTIVLPEPRPAGELSLEEVLAARRSIRHYTSQPLTPDDLSQLLWAAQGITEPGGRGRAAPSAGGSYPLELYVVAPEGLYHYLPDGHALEVLGVEDLRRPLAEAALGQEHVAEAAGVVVIAAVFRRTEERYGERAERYVHLEAGHAAQNVLLQAVALGLGAVPVGAFRDGEVQELLGLPPDRMPLYLIPVGHPAGE